MYKFLKIGMLVSIVFGFGAGAANAALITGEMGITGSYEADNSTLTLGSVTGTSGAGDLGTTVGFLTFGTVNNGVINYSPFSPAMDVFAIGGWGFDITSLTVDDPDVAALKLSGTGVLSGAGFDDTAATWTFSAQSAASYSLSVSAVVVPVPAAAWLFGTGLMGLVAVARRKA